MQIRETNADILTQLEDLVMKLDDVQFTSNLECLFHNSVGKHIRHILEFYQLMIDGSANGIVNYDKRDHARALEEDRKLAIEKIRSLRSTLETIPDKEVNVETSYFLQSDNFEVVRSSVLREMVYNIEHAIHHMAIIKIGLTQAFPQIELSKNFGIAYSTIKYMEKECAQ